MAIHDPWRDLIAEPVSRDHFVQVYRDERVLVEAVALFAGAALGRNEAVVLVATREHGQAVEQGLTEDGFDVAQLKSWAQLTILDAQEVLSRFMVDGSPDEARFKAVIRDLVGSTKAMRRFREVRVYGEMVNLLWSENLPAARRLEELWNDVIEEHSIALFCAYCLDAAGQRDRVFPPDLRALHTHYIPLEGGA
jgi:DcmR-like sensory protein